MWSIESRSNMTFATTINRPQDDRNRWLSHETLDSRRRGWPRPDGRCFGQAAECAHRDRDWKNSTPTRDYRSYFGKQNRKGRCSCHGADRRNSSGQTNSAAHSTLPPIAIDDVKIDIVTSNDGAEVKCTARTVAQTGVEMEALTGVSIALLTIYDMCKPSIKRCESQTFVSWRKRSSCSGGL